jgi:hypothetical protein
MTKAKTAKKTTAKPRAKKTVGERVIEGAEEALAHVKGEETNVVVHEGTPAVPTVEEFEAVPEPVETKEEQCARNEALQEAAMEVPFGSQHQPFVPQDYANLSLATRVKDGFAALRDKIMRKLPRLVWYGDEVDVLVTFTGDKYTPEELSGGEVVFDNHRNATKMYLNIAEVAMYHAGIGFDRGYGASGRDWMLDYSVTGPMRIKFVGRNKTPLNRV